MFERNGEEGGETENSADCREESRVFISLMFYLVLSSPASILFLGVCLLGHGSRIYMHIYTHTHAGMESRERGSRPLSLLSSTGFRLL